VRTGCAVKNISKGSVIAGDDTIPAGLAIWAAGVKPASVAKMLGAPLDESGRVKVDRDLSVPAFAGVYALGDIALCHDADGNKLPGLAQVAKQQGEYLGAALTEKLRTGAAAKAFVFQNRGNVAITGRHAAVADFGWLRLKGMPAWVIWALIHIYLLAGLQHRILVTVQWLWRYLTYDRGARQIVEPVTANDGGVEC
jgi:NADH dehydrogenase